MVSGPEARRIETTLKSIAEWVSEIVVVLNEEVNDGTEEIILRHGGRVYREPWRGFLAQKNSAAGKATQPWVLNLDADESVSDALRQELESVFRGHPERADAFSMPRCSLYLDRWIRHGDWYPDRCTRLWRRGKARWVGVDPHVRLEVDGAVERLRGDLLHRSMETFEHQLAKTVRYADDFARHAVEHGPRVGMVDLLFRPVWRFVRAYFLRLGFLDGWQGCCIAWMTAFYTFLRYAKARAAQMETGK